MKHNIYGIGIGNNARLEPTYKELKPTPFQSHSNHANKIRAYL
ncbi:MAG: hypothetical protein CH6_1031 [Candidatus Kapaibacterium sp.]|nr:MAG: hypothetical protein CH6_1031 [Candidatus Kapabacteria bacterium]